MGPAEIFMIAVGLAMDAFAVSIAAGTSGALSGKRAVFRLSFHFGLFQAAMPVIGWYAGIRIVPLISTAGHWIAFGLLLFVGIRMIISSVRTDIETFMKDPSKGFSLVILSVATSIDALAVGLSLAMIRINIWYPSAIIGLVTAALSVIGINAGKHLGKKLGPGMGIAGGILLILIGFKILFSRSMP